jgi:hypothetical protein
MQQQRVLILHAAAVLPARIFEVLNEKEREGVCIEFPAKNSVPNCGDF